MITKQFIYAEQTYRNAYIEKLLVRNIIPIAMLHCAVLCGVVLRTTSQQTANAFELRLPNCRVRSQLC